MRKIAAWAVMGAQDVFMCVTHSIHKCDVTYFIHMRDVAYLIHIVTCQV